MNGSLVPVSVSVDCVIVVSLPSDYLSSGWGSEVRVCVKDCVVSLRSLRFMTITCVCRYFMLEIGVVVQLCAVFTEKALDFVPLDVSLYVLGLLIGSEVVFSVMMLVEVCSLVSMPCHNYVMGGSVTARTVLLLFLF